MSTIDPAAREAATNLRRAVSRLQRSFRATRDPDGPTPAQLSVLGSLVRHGPLATGELARHERLKPQSVTRLVAALEDAGSIARVVDDADARRILVTITARGRAQLGREMRRRDERLAARIAQLGASDRAAVRAATALLEWLASASEGDG
jgi:DNA-binding MarR family transcriptional regulator